jgi:hypothetical protein
VPRVNVSPTTSEILRALGARANTKVRNVEGVRQALKSGEIDGVEADVRTALVNGYIPLAPYTGAPLFSKVTTIAASSARLHVLGSEATAWIRTAAERTAAAERDAELRTTWKGACGAGMKPTPPTPAQLDALHAAVHNFDATLDGDSGSALAVDRIGVLATRSPATDPWAICGGRAPRDSSPLDGTYEFRYSAAELASMGAEPGNDGAYRVRFGHGRYAIFHLGRPDPLMPGWSFDRDPVEVGSLLVRGDVAVLRPQTSIGLGSLTKTYRFELFRDRLSWLRAIGHGDMLLSARPWRKTG